MAPNTVTNVFHGNGYVRSHRELCANFTVKLTHTSLGKLVADHHLGFSSRYV